MQRTFYPVQKPPKPPSDISQQRLAAKAGLDRSYLSCVERGTRNVSLLNVARIAKVLGITIAALFREVDL